MTWLLKRKRAVAAFQVTEPRFLSRSWHTFPERESPWWCMVMICYRYSSITVAPSWSVLPTYPKTVVASEAFLRRPVRLDSGRSAVCRACLTTYLACQMVYAIDWIPISPGGRGPGANTTWLLSRGAEFRSINQKPWYHSIVVDSFGQNPPPGCGWSVWPRKKFTG